MNAARQFGAFTAREVDAKRIGRAAAPVLTRTLLPVFALAGLVALLAALACSAAATPTAPPATPAPTAATLPTPATEGGTVLEAVIGPAREDCVGVAEMRCLVVDGFLFYSEIDGFDYQEGYEYRLLMEQYEAYPGQEIPADAGRYGYRLIEVLEKTGVR